MGHHSEEIDNEAGLQGGQPVELPLQPIILQDEGDQQEQIAADNVENMPRELELDQIEQIRQESIELRVNPAGMQKAIIALHTTYSKVR